MLEMHDSRNNIINHMMTRGRDCDRNNNARLMIELPMTPLIV
jgi:hypothetical protein